MAVRSTKITNGKIVTPAGVMTGDLIIEEGSIAEVITSSKQITTDEEIDADGAYILPGFIDIHTNGAFGFDCTFGKYQPESGSFSSEHEDYLQSLEDALKYYLKKGCTKIILSSISASLDQVLKILKHTSDYKNAVTEYSSCLFGLMIEGSFIKESGFQGAHNPDHFQRPGIDIIDQMINVSDGLVKIVNIPPEWEEDIWNIIEHVTDKNIIAAAGHTSCSGSQMKKAAEKGTQLVIHLFNGPSSSSFKPFGNGGAIEEALRNDSLFAEIITDGIHVDKAYVLDAVKRKGVDKVIAITDSMFTVGLPDLKEFVISGKTGCVSNDGKYLYVKEKPEALFGSNLSMDEAFCNLLNWFTDDTEGIWHPKHDRYSLEDALVMASVMCSFNPAKLLGIDQACGSIEPGKSADLVLGNITRKNGYEININKVLLKGKEVNA